MLTAYLIVSLVAVASNAFPGTAALARFRPVLPGVARAGVAVSWLRFPIGTLKTADRVGVPLVGRPPRSGWRRVPDTVEFWPLCPRPR